MHIKKHLIPALCALGLSLPAEAQRNAKATAEDYINQYQFDQAEELLNQDIKRLKRRRQPTTAEEEQLQKVEKMRSMMRATERLTVIDSLVVDKKTFLDHIRLSEESGTLHTYAAFFNRTDSNGCTVYRSELGNKIYFAQPDEQQILRLYTSDLVGGKWTTPHELDELGGDEAQNYPFMMSDGVTLYYAAQGTESIGGYDIFVTRYDMDEKKFLYPENIGMPYNSPANDYLYAIDEFNNLGWFATDRNQPAGKVCIYTFIPNPSRETYVLTEYNADEVRAAARIASVARTQAGSRKLAEAKAVLAQLRAEPAEAAQGSSFSFITADGRLFTSVRQLPDAQSRKLGEQWSAATTQLSQQREQLDQMRRSYAAADAGGRQQMTSAILKLEKDVERLETQADRLASQLRQAVRAKQ